MPADWLSRLLVRRPLSHIDALLVADSQAPEIVKKILSSFDAWAPQAINEATRIFLVLRRSIEASNLDIEAEAKLDAIARRIGSSRDTLAKLVNSSDAQPVAEEARAVYLPYRAREMSKVLFTLCGRQFRWMGTDLFRGRVTSAIGYVRLQAESVALVHLFLHDPTQADAWYQAGLSGDGRAFYRKTQRRLM